jgi:hypothetical protein
MAEKVMSTAACEERKASFANFFIVILLVDVAQPVILSFAALHKQRFGHLKSVTRWKVFPVAACDESRGDASCK